MGSKLKGRRRSLASRAKQRKTWRKRKRLQRLAGKALPAAGKVKGSRREWKAKMKLARAQVDGAIARLLEIVATEPR